MEIKGFFPIMEKYYTHTPVLLCLHHSCLGLKMSQTGIRGQKVIVKPLRFDSAPPLGYHNLSCLHLFALAKTRRLPLTHLFSNIVVTM